MYDKLACQRYYQRHKNDSDFRARMLKRNHEWKQRNPEQSLKAVKRYQRKIRLEVLSHYGGNSPQCACCGEVEFAFLGIDHIAGGGTKHRIVTGRGSHLYLWLRKNGYPTGFQVLCHNCNMAKGFYGACPHERTKLT